MSNEPKRSSVPTVHINGTSQEELLTQLGEALTAGREFLRKLENASPNARDYYPQGDGAFKIANEEHLSRCAAVKRVVQELMVIAEHVADAK